MNELTLVSHAFPRHSLTGYDMDGSGTARFAAGEVSQGKSRVVEFRDTPLDMVLAESRDYEMKIAGEQHPFQSPVPENDPVRHRLFSVAELAERGAVTPEELELLQANHYDYVTFDNRLHFRADDARVIRFDPDGSGRNDLIGYIRGTSFAVPAALAHDLSGGSFPVHNRPAPSPGCPAPWKKNIECLP